MKFKVKPSGCLLFFLYYNVQCITRNSMSCKLKRVLLTPIIWFFYIKFLKINYATQVKSVYNDGVKKKTNQIQDFCTVLRNLQEVNVISKFFACDPSSGEMLISVGNKQLQVKGRSWIQMNHFLAGVEQHLPFHYNTDETYQLVKSGRRRKMWLLLGMQNHLLFCTAQEFQELARFSTLAQCHW